MKRRIQLVAGLLIAVFLVWFLFRGTDWNAVWLSIKSAGWGWMLACELFILLSFFTRVQRWSYIVRSAKPASYADMFHATQIGFMGNFVLPLRMGEAIRGLVLSKRIGLPFTKCFAFVALDRLTDLIGLIVVMLIAAISYNPVDDILLPPEIYSSPIPSNIVRIAVLSTAAALIFVFVCFVLFYFGQKFAIKLAGIFVPIGTAVLRFIINSVLFLPGLIADKPVSKLRTSLNTFFGESFTEKIQRLIIHFAEGMHIFRSTSDMIKTFFYTVITWLLLTASYYAMLRSFNLDVPWYTPFLIVSMLSAMISMPGTPGFIGQFHAGIIAGVFLASPSMTGQPDTVKAFAILTHILHTLPVLAAGLFSLYATRSGLLELGRQGAQIQEHTDADNPELSQ